MAEWIARARGEPSPTTAAPARWDRSPEIEALAAADPAAALAAAERSAGPGIVKPAAPFNSNLIETFAAIDWRRCFELVARTDVPAALRMLISADENKVAEAVGVLRAFGSTDADAAARTVEILHGRQKEIKALSGGPAANPLTAAARLWLASQPVNMKRILRG